MLVTAILAANWDEVRNLCFAPFGVFCVPALTLAAVCWWVGRWLRTAILRDTGAWLTYSILWVFLLILSAFCVLALWSRYRWGAAFDDPDWPRQWPYPDRSLRLLQTWLDSRSGETDMHDEFYTVWRVLSIVSIALSSIVGGLSGVLVPKICLLRARRRHDTIVTSTRRAT